MNFIWIITREWKCMFDLNIPEIPLSTIVTAGAFALLILRMILKVLLAILG